MRGRSRDSVKVSVRYGSCGEHANSHKLPKPELTISGNQLERLFGAGDRDTSLLSCYLHVELLV